MFRQNCRAAFQLDPSALNGSVSVQNDRRAARDHGLDCRGARTELRPVDLYCDKALDLAEHGWLSGAAVQFDIGPAFGCGRLAIWMSRLVSFREFLSGACFPLRPLNAEIKCLGQGRLYLSGKTCRIFRLIA